MVIDCLEVTRPAAMSKRSKPALRGGQTDGKAMWHTYGQTGSLHPGLRVLYIPQKIFRFFLFLPFTAPW
jgi:hypothetical protein